MEPLQRQAAADEPPVDLSKHIFDDRLVVRTGDGIVPGQRPQPRVRRVRIGGRFRFESPPQMEHEPGVAAAIAGRFDGLVVPLQQALRVREAPRLFGVTGRRKEKDLGRNPLRRDLA